MMYVVPCVVASCSILYTSCSSVLLYVVRSACLEICLAMLLCSVLVLLTVAVCCALVISYTTSYCMLFCAVLSYYCAVVRRHGRVLLFMHLLSTVVRCAELYADHHLND